MHLTCTDPKKLDQKSNDLEVGIFMAKYSFELKKKIVEAYLNGEGSYSELATQYGILGKRQVCKWVNIYNELGDKGLLRSRRNDTYSFKYKIHVVELYLSSEVSYQELALQEKIKNPAIITKWVNDFRIAGSDALRPKKKGRKKSLDSSGKKKDISPIEAIPLDTGAEHVKQLEDELLKLRIENAYLKEQRRLRLEEEALLKKRRELFTASEENSN